jgi:hypothetical protein
MDNLDQLESAYKLAIDHWVNAIRDEEALANGDHSLMEMEKWDAAALHLHDVEREARKARDLYKSALRQKNYGF